MKVLKKRYKNRELQAFQGILGQIIVSREIVNAFMLVIAVMIIWKTARNCSYNYVFAIGDKR